MFQGWGFLLGEIWVLIALAALTGLVAGWLIWGRWNAGESNSAIADRLQADLDACRARGAEAEARIAALHADLVAAHTKAAMASAQDEAETVGTKPGTLWAPRGGVPDDLKRIRGIGPKLERLCNQLGVWHFDQIANWSVEEIAWVDANLEGFKGRVTRDDWVSQARILATEQR